MAASEFTQTPKSHQPYKYLIYFVAAFISCYLVQQMLFNRLISIGDTHFYITGGCFIYFTSPLIMDVVAEVYGYRVARKILWAGLFALLFMGVCIAICLHMPTPPFWKKTAEAYNIAIGPVVRISIISAIAVLIGEFLNAYLITKWRILTRGKYFWMRSVGSSVIGDAATLLVANIAAFGGRVPMVDLVRDILPQAVIMVVFSAIGAIPASYLARFVAKAENLNTFDVGVNFNPFKLN